MDTEQIRAGSHTIYFSPQLTQIVNESIGPHKNASQRVTDIAERYGEILRAQETKVRARFNKAELLVLSLIVVNNYLSANQIDTGIPTLVLNNRKHIKKVGIDPIELSQAIASLSYSQKCALMELVAKHAYYEEAKEETGEAIRKTVQKNEIKAVKDIAEEMGQTGEGLQALIERQTEKNKIKEESDWFYDEADAREVEVVQLSKKLQHLTTNDLAVLPSLVYDNKPTAEEKSVREVLTQGEINVLHEMSERLGKSVVRVARQVEKKGVAEWYKWRRHTKEQAMKWRERLTPTADGTVVDTLKKLKNTELEAIPLAWQVKLPSHEKLQNELGAENLAVLAEIISEKKMVLTADLTEVMPEILSGAKGHDRINPGATEDTEGGEEVAANEKTLKEKIAQLTDEEIGVIPSISTKANRQKEKQKERIEATITKSEIELLVQAAQHVGIATEKCAGTVKQWITAHKKGLKEPDRVVEILREHGVNPEALLEKMARLTPVERAILPQLSLATTED